MIYTREEFSKKFNAMLGELHQDMREHPELIDEVMVFMGNNNSKILPANEINQSKEKTIK